MRKLFIVTLIVLGVALGYWFARQNQRFFELPMPSGGAFQQTGQTRGTDTPVSGTVEIGMDTWQVREILGPPDRRIVGGGQEGRNHEAWVYGKRTLHFINGYCTHWEGE